MQSFYSLLGGKYPLEHGLTIPVCNLTDTKSLVFKATALIWRRKMFLGQAQSLAISYLFHGLHITRLWAVLVESKHCRLTPWGEKVIELVMLSSLYFSSEQKLIIAANHTQICLHVLLHPSLLPCCKYKSSEVTLWRHQALIWLMLVCFQELKRC